MEPGALEVQSWCSQLSGG